MMRLSRFVPGGVIMLVCTTMVASHGQEAYTTWSQVEASKETRDYKEKLREGSPFDGGAKVYLTEVALPQLAMDANRRTIDRVRRRMRELLLTEIADEKAFDEASKTVRDFMLALARNEQADAAVRVNAMLLVGDLKARDGKPWPAAATSLATAVRDAKLPVGVRLAALAGLARHAEAARMADGEAAAAFAKDAGPAVLSIIGAAAKPQQPPTPRTADAVWMTTRALVILPVVVRAAPKDVAAALSAIMGDESWPVDVRVRAAAALGATATAQTGLNAAQTIEGVRNLATTALRNDITAADQRRAEQEYRAANGGQPAGVPGLPPGPAPGGFGFGGDAIAQQPTVAGGIPEQVARRDAWRLATLADAILDADGKRGLATLLGKNGEAAAALAAALRENAISLDASPTEDTVAAALESLASPQAATPRQATSAAKKPEAEPAEPEAAASPFDASPFGQ